VSNNISISAYNDHEEGRLDRLDGVRAEIAAKRLPVIALHDHKGTLNVNWSETPRTEQVMEVMAIWRNNSEYLGNHYVRGKKLILDVEGDSPFK
jgi:hypothetical protein